jgi:hypothetical protein
VKILTRAAAGSALLVMTAGCASTGASSKPPVHAGNFTAVAAACSLISGPTAKTLGLKAKGSEQPTARRTGVEEKTCIWPAAATHSGGRSLTVIVDLFTAAGGQTPAAAATDQFQANTSTQEQADGSRGHSVAGLANQAFIDQVRRSSISEVQLVTRDQNVLVTIAYDGFGTATKPVATSALDAGALTAARTALSALASS